MKQSKNSLTIFLMTSSMVLLLALQIVWLRSSYEKAFYDFRSKASGLFRTAVFAVRDSTLFQNIETVPADSSVQIQSTYIYKRTTDSVKLPPVDQMKTMDVRRTEGQVQVYVSSKGRADSVKTWLRPFAARVREGSIQGGARFIIRMDRDSLSTDSIRAQFGRNIARAGLQVSFDIKKENHLNSFSHSNPPPGFEGILMRRRLERDDKSLPVFGDTVQSEWIRVDPANQYAAIFTGIRPVLLKEIAPQVFFSGVLTLLTSVSFIFMFRSIRSQQRLMALKNDFISNITHELKTPIATVSVALEALKNFKGIDNPKLTNEYLDIAQHELGRLSVLTDKVLTTSLFDERGVTFDLEKVDLERGVVNILDSMKLVLEKQRASVSFEKKGTAFTVPGSSLHLTNVIYNLMDNALKYSPSGPSIVITLTDLGEGVSLAVTDHGLGIPGEFHKKIFEKFFRIPSGDVHNIKGHGLGLSYVDSVVKSHGGKIELKSKIGEGSTFTVTLPKAKRNSRQ